MNQLLACLLTLLLLLSGSVMGKSGHFGSFSFASKPPAQFAEGSFSITPHGWQGYPAGVPKSAGPFRLIEGAEYNAARSAANSANNQIRVQQGLRGQPVDVHEIQLVKFGGSATDPANKVILDRVTVKSQIDTVRDCQIVIG